MSSLDKIPVVLEGAGLQHNAAPVLHEIRHALVRLARGGGPTTIDLAAIPFDPGDEGRLLDTLGRGEVRITVDALGPTDVWETAYPGVWVLEYRNTEGERIALQVEVTDIPAVVRSQPADIEDSAARLGEALGADSLPSDAPIPLRADVPVLGFAAFSGTGKTTLLKAVIPLLRERGVRLGLIKHAHHEFDLDIPGKDSYELRKAGAGQVLVASRIRWALIHENAPPREPVLQTLLDRLDQQALDLILVEGFKREGMPKIELQRPDLGHPAIHLGDPQVIAVATDGARAQAVDLPVLDLNDPGAIAEFILRWLDGQRAVTAGQT